MSITNLKEERIKRNPYLAYSHWELLELVPEHSDERYTKEDFKDSINFFIALSELAVSLNLKMACETKINEYKDRLKELG